MIMACFEKQSPSSVLSPLLGTDTDSFCSSPDESNYAGAVGVSSAVAWAGGLSPKRALSSTSISSTSIEGSATRASKRRRKSRAKPKAPITQLLASKLDFRDIVHQFTGSRLSSTTTFNQRCSSHPHMPRTAQNNVVVFNSHHMPSALAHTSLSRKDALLAAALLAESLSTLETISSYFLQPNLSSATQDTANTQTATSSSCNGKHVVNACRSVEELENFLLKGETKLDTFFPLSCALLNQIAGQCGASSHK